MISNRSILGLIPARGGSKGLKRKNLLPLGGKPLLSWTIEAAKQSLYLDHLIISSEDDELIEVARSYGCDAPFKRQAQLATDETPSLTVVRDALLRCPGFDYVVLLQPTSPLRTAHDIDQSLALCVGSGAPACVSVCGATDNPHWMFSIGENMRLMPLVSSGAPSRRQDLPKFHSLNGAIYIAKTKWIMSAAGFVTTETVGYEMPVERSIDIDTDLDLLFAELLIARRDCETGIY